MQRYSGAVRGARELASGGFVPPSWADFAPRLRASVGLWVALFLLAIARLFVTTYFLSPAFRARSRQEKLRSSRAESWLSMAARFWRTARLKIAMYEFSEAYVARYFGLPRFVAGVVVCVLYIVDTYMQGIPSYFYIFQALYGVAVVVNLFRRFVYSDQPVYFMLSLNVLVECLSIPSLLSSYSGLWLNFNFLQAYCVLMEWSILEKHDIVLYNYSSLARLLVNLVLQMITFVFVTSCGVQLFELLGDPSGQLGSETFQITWANAVYFAVVTLMTVGYGDFVPYTLFGRLWIVFHIIFAAYLVSRELSLLVDALKSMRRGAGSYVESAVCGHVVVTGHVKWEFLLQFTKEFLAYNENLNCKIVVLVTDPEWTEDDWNRSIIQEPFFDFHLIYLEGSPLKIEDLQRAQAAAAHGVFVLADPHRNDPYHEDSDTLKALLTVRNYAVSVPIYTINALHDSSFQFKIAMEQVDPEDTDWIFGDRSILGKSRTYNTFAHLLPSVPPPHDDPIFEGGNFDGTGVLTGFGDPVSTGRPDESSQSLLHSTPNQAKPPTSTLSAALTPNYSTFPVNQSLLGGALGHASSFMSNSGLNELYHDDETARAASGAGYNIAAVKKRHGARLSESICMQKLEMALLAENVFCNGLSTLITNLTLRVQLESRLSDPPWLLEYKLGTECRIRFLRLPEPFRGRRLGDVAAALYDYGLVIVALRKSREHNWCMVSTDTVLDPDMTSAVLTYHEGNVIYRIAAHAAKFVEEQTMCSGSENGSSYDVDGDVQDNQSVAPNRSLGAAGIVYSQELGIGGDFVDALGTSPGDAELVPQSADSRAHNADAGQPLHHRRAPYTRKEDRSTPRDAHRGDQLRTWQHSDKDSMARGQKREGGGYAKESVRETGDAVSDDVRNIVRPLAPRTESGRDAPCSKQARAAATLSSLPRLDGSRDRDSGQDMSRAHSIAGPNRSTSARGVPSSGVKRQRTSGTSGKSGRSVAMIYSNREALPAHLRGHVIVCLDGEHPLINLDYLLRRIWNRRIGSSKETPVVVIHPCFPKNFEREIMFAKHDIFLLKGNSLSLDTLEQAQFQSSSAILIMSSESTGTGTKGSTDSKAIFTVMTLDSLLNENANTFVCCMLDAEDSLQLLRSPTHARRCGINLGVRKDASVFYRENSGFGRGLMRGSTSNYRLSQRALSNANLSRSLSVLPFANIFPQVQSKNAHASTSGIFRISSVDSSHALRQRLTRTTSVATGMKPSGVALKRSVSTRFDNVNVSDEEEHADQSSVHNLRTMHHTQQTSRDEMCERQRFASGEMMISSLFAGMLVREYVNSGYLNLVREMIGTGNEGHHSWVRQIDVPESWVESSPAIDGRTYRETFARLIELGCVALGLYRSGDAPVRMELDDDFVGYDSSGTGVRGEGFVPGLRANAHRGTSMEQILQPGNFSFQDDPLLQESSDDFDEMYYDCPSTQRRIRYQEAECGENALPYVYTNPEPYTIVSASDAVFVLCPPTHAIPTTW